jgi:transcriptional regulator with GAF, ATPase, and Fis domain
MFRQYFSDKTKTSYIILALFIVSIIAFVIAILNSTEQQTHKISGLSKACEAIFEVKAEEDLYFDSTVLNSDYYSESLEDSIRFNQHFARIAHIVGGKNGDLNALFANDLPLRDSFKTYAAELAMIERKTFQRGFESKGLYGKLRNIAHKIEQLYQDNVVSLSRFAPLIAIGENTETSRIIAKNLLDTVANAGLSNEALRGISKNLLAYTNLLNARRYEKDYLYRHSDQYYDMAKACIQNSPKDTLIGAYIQLLDAVKVCTDTINSGKNIKSANWKTMTDRLQAQIKQDKGMQWHWWLLLGLFALFALIAWVLYLQYQENEELQKAKDDLGYNKIAMEQDKGALSNNYEQLGRENKQLQQDKETLEQDKKSLYEDYERLLRLAKNITEISTFDQSFKNIVQRTAATVKVLMDDKIDMFVAGQVDAQRTYLTLYKQLYSEDLLTGEKHNIETNEHKNSVRCFNAEKAICSFDNNEIDKDETDNSEINNNKIDKEDPDIKRYPSVIYVPLRYQNKVIGVFGIKSRIKDNLNHLHLNKLKLITYFFEQAYTNNQQINSLINLMKAIRESANLEDIINNMGTSMIALFPDVMSFGIGVLDTADTQIQFTGTYRKSIDAHMVDTITGTPEPRQYKDATYPASLCIASHQTYFHDINRNIYELTFDGSQNSTSFIYHKLRVNDRTVGVFSVHFFEKKRLTVNDTDKIRMLSYFFQELSIFA